MDETARSRTTRIFVIFSVVFLVALVFAGSPIVYTRKILEFFIFNASVFYAMRYRIKQLNRVARA